jgi:Lhr-like helicase
MVIRLAGKNWKVVDIDERSYEVIVTHVEEAGEAPSLEG